MSYEKLRYELDEHVDEELGRIVLVGDGSVGAEAGQVAARREHLLVGRGEDDDADLGVGLRCPQRLEQLAQELLGERVSRLGIVEGDRRDRVLDGVAQLLVGHK